MGGTGNSRQDYGQALAVIAALVCAFIGYGAQGPAGALVGGAVGYGLGYLGAAFVQNLAVFIASGLALVGIALLIVSRVNFMQRQFSGSGDGAHSEIAFPVQSSEAAAEKQRQDDAIDSVSALVNPASIMLRNTCGAALKVHLRWHVPDAGWRAEGPWTLAPGSVEVLKDRNGETLETSDQDAYLAAQPEGKAQSAEGPPESGTPMRHVTPSVKKIGGSYYRVIDVACPA